MRLPGNSPYKRKAPRGYAVLRLKRLVVKAIWTF